MKLKAILSILLLDQLTKYLTIIYQPDIQFKGIGIFYWESKGYLLGLFNIIPYNRWLTILIMLFCLFMVQLLFRFYENEYRKNRLTYISYILIMGGFLGNFMDCIISEYVVDIFRVPIAYATNIADIAIFSGLAVLIWEFAMDRKFLREIRLKPFREELRLAKAFFKFSRKQK